MTTVIDGTTGIDKVKDGSIVQSDLTPSLNQLVAKAHCVFDGSLTGTNPPLVGNNVASVTRLGAGVYEINFTTPFADSSYSVSATSDAGTTGLIAVVYYSFCTGVKARVHTYTVGALSADSGRVSVVIFKVGA